MRTANRAQLVELAHKAAGPISRILRLHCGFDPVNERHFVDVAGFGAALLAAGYEIKYRPGTHDGVFVEVYLSGVLKAAGFSGLGEEDALAHAGLGAVREEDAEKVVGDALREKGVKVDAALFQKLQSRYIAEGGRARLEKDMELFNT